MKHLFIFLFAFLSINHLHSQCGCINCPVTLPTSGAASADANISGAANNNLDSPNQSVCRVCIEMLHDAIAELDITLIAPDGSSVQLVEDTGFGIGQNITYEICFVACSQDADPDSGFPDVFDSSQNYESNETYEGSYYPNGGCLENLSGPVDGTWTLEFFDNVGADGGNLFNWNIVFADDTGLNCEDADECEFMPSCLAEGGELDGSFETLCEGDPGLDFDLPPTYPDNNEPPSSSYGYSYIISNTDGEFIEDIASSPDLTSYPPGTYQICGLSFLNDDESDIPNPNGSVSIDDIQDDIDNDDYCADISEECVIVVIEPGVEAPIIDGPLVVCAGEDVEYEITNFNPLLTYLVSITSGGFNSFFGEDELYMVNWSLGPGRICFIAQSSCDMQETCIDVDVLAANEEFDLIGETNPCPGSVHLYEIVPLPTDMTEFEFTTGGTVINVDDFSIEIEWPNSEGNFEVCAEIINSSCPSDEICIDIDVELDYQLPNSFESPEEICIGEIADALAEEDNDIINYIWTATDLEIISDPNASSIQFTGDDEGTGTLCLEIETNCGTQGPICQDVDVLSIPEVSIEDTEPTCDQMIELISDADPSFDIEWNQINGPGNINFDPDDTPSTIANASESGIYTVEIIVTNGNCQDSDEVVIEVLDNLLVSDPFFECNEDNFYTVSFTILSGDSPYTVNGESINGDDYVSEPIESEEDFEFLIEDNLGCSVTIEDEYECPCLSDAGTMDDDPIIICVSEDPEFFIVPNGDAILDNDDLALFYIHDNDDDELGNVIAISEDGTFEYNEDDYLLNTVYFVSYVVGNPDGDEIDLSDICLSVAEGQPISFTGFPELEIASDLSTCDNEIEISGDLPLGFDISWSQTSGPGSSTFNDIDKLPTTVTVSEQGNYTFRAELSNGSCFEESLVDIEFRTAPQILNIIETCTPSADQYIVSFDAFNGSPPFVANIPGTFTGNNFVSEPIPSGQSYSISITDANGCSSNAFTGSKLCDCITNSGSMSISLVEVCVDQDSIKIEPVSNTQLDADDIGLYYLHTSSTNILGDILDIQKEPTFVYGNNLMTDVIYYVSFVVGNNVQGSIDLNDPCLDVSSGQPVIWQSVPTADAGLDDNACSNSISLNANNTSGIWSIIESPLSANPLIQNINDPNTLLNFDIPGEYILEWTVTNGQCIDKDTISLIKNIEPSVTAVDTECSLDLLTFTATLSLSGSTGGFTVNGSPTNNTFTLDNLDVNQTLDVTIVNDQGCNTAITLGPVSCNCFNDSGTIVNAPQNLCSFDLIDVNISNGDFTLGQEDTLAYIIHDGDRNNIGNIISISYGDNIPFDSNTMDFNTEYFIIVATGNILDDEIDLNDACFQFTQGSLITWTQDINVNIDGIYENCIGENVDITVSSNTTPLQITLINGNGETRDLTLTDNNQSFEFEVMNTFESWTIDQVNGSCVNDIQGIIQITGQQQTEFTFIEQLEVCNNPLFGSRILLDDIFEGLRPEGDFISDEIILENNELVFDNLNEGSYTIAYSTVGLDGLCPGIESSFEINIINCDCPVFNIVEIELCQNLQTFDLSNLNVQSFEGFWSIDELNLTNPEILNDGVTLDFTNSDPGSFNLIYNITQQDYPSQCESSIAFPLIISEILNSGEQIDFPVLCENEEQEINLNDLVINQNDNGIWLDNGNEISEIINTGQLNIGNNIYQYSTVQNGSCEAQLTDVIIEISALPEFEVTSENIICFGENNGEIIFTIENTTGETINCYLNDILQNQGKVIDNLGPGEYEVFISTEECVSETEIITISEPEPVTVSLGEDRIVAVNDSVNIQAIVNILESDIGSISWSDLAGAIDIDILELRSIFSNDNSISIEITDENGCIGFDQINISVIQGDFYIPNIIAFNSQNNNTFQILNFDQISIINKMSIFDRWGNKVYEQNNITPDDERARWNGRYNDTPVIQGVYVYMFELTLNDGSSEIIAGDITIIR